MMTTRSLIRQPDLFFAGVAVWLTLGWVGLRAPERCEQPLARVVAWRAWLGFFRSALAPIVLLTLMYLLPNMNRDYILHDPYVRICWVLLTIMLLSILFTDHLQLLTFSFMMGVPFLPEHKKALIDMALSGDADYFSTFCRDLAEFCEENNAWVTWISTPLLCYYEPLYALKKSESADPGAVPDRHLSLCGANSMVRL